MNKKIIFLYLLCANTPLALEAMAPTDDIEHCLTHISRVPELDTHRISGFHFYDTHACESANIRLPGNSKTVTIEQLKSNPDKIWIYKVDENNRGDFAGYVIKDGEPYGPRTFFGPQESREMLRNRLLLEHPTYADISGRSIRYFDGQNAQESGTALVYDIDTNRLITAYPPLESFNFSEQHAANVAVALAQLQTTRLSKPASWRALHDTNLKNFKAALGECTEQQQQDLLDSAATQHKWDLVEALVQNNQNLAPSALLQAIKHLNRDFAETCLRFIDDKDAHLGIGKPTPLIAICTLPAAQNESSRTSKRELIALLLDEGAQINSPDEQGRTPLMYAARSGDTDTVAMLIERGADSNIRDNTGKNAASFAQETLTSLKKRAGSPTALENFEIIQTCLSSPTRETEQKDKKLRKKEKKQSSATRSTPENKLATLNTLLAQDPENAICTTREFIKNITRAEISDTTEIKKQRLAHINILIQKTPPTLAESLGVLCNSLIKKGLLSITELMKILLPTSTTPTISTACITGIISNIEIPFSSANWHYAEQLLQQHKNATLTTLMLKKCDLYSERFNSKTLFKHTIERGNPEEIGALFTAYDGKYTEEELKFAITNGFAMILIETISQTHPNWSNFRCMLHLGKAYADTPEMLAEFQKQSPEERVKLLEIAIETNNHTMFDVLTSSQYHANAIIMPDGSSPLMRLFKTNPGIARTNNPLFVKLIEFTNVLQQNQENQTIFDLLGNDPNIRPLLDATQQKLYAIIRDLLFAPKNQALEVRRLMLLIKQPAINPLWQYDDNQTLLACAIAVQNKTAIDILLKKTPVFESAPVSMQHPATPTPLCYAFVNGDQELCQKLLDRGANWLEVLEYIYSGIKQFEDTQKQKTSPFFNILRATKKPIFKNSVLGEWTDQIRACALHYAIAQSHDHLAQQIFAEQTPLTVSFEFFGMTLAYTFIYANDTNINILLSPLVNIDYQRQPNDTVYATQCNKPWLSLPDELTDSSNMMHITPQITKDLATKAHISFKEAQVALTLKQIYLNSSSPELRQHIQKQFVHFAYILHACPDILTSLLVATNSAAKTSETPGPLASQKINIHQYVNRETVKFLFQLGATSDSLPVDLSLAIEYTLPEKVQSLLDEHPELLRTIDNEVTISQNGVIQQIPPALISAFSKYDDYCVFRENLCAADPSNNYEQLKKEAFDIVTILFRQCGNILKPMTFPCKNPSTNQLTQASMTPMDNICGTYLKELSTKEIETLLMPVPINQEYNNTFIVEYCFNRIFAQQAGIPITVAAINWILDHQDKPDKRLSDEHLIAVCRLFHLTFHSFATQDHQISSIDAGLARSIVHFIELIEQRENLEQTPEVIWTKEKFKRFFTEKKQVKHSRKVYVI